MAPIYISSSVPGKVLAMTYTALFVVRALKNTAPVTVASGYASWSHGCNGGMAAFRAIPMKMSQDAVPSNPM